MSGVIRIPKSKTFSIDSRLKNTLAEQHCKNSNCDECKYRKEIDAMLDNKIHFGCINNYKYRHFVLITIPNDDTILVLKDYLAQQELIHVIEKHNGTCFSDCTDCNYNTRDRTVRISIVDDKDNFKPFMDITESLTCFDYKRLLWKNGYKI